MNGSFKGFLGYIFPVFSKNESDYLKLTCLLGPAPLPNAAFSTFARKFWTGHFAIDAEELKKVREFNSPFRSALLAYIGSPKLAAKTYEDTSRPEIAWAFFKSLFFIPFHTPQLFTEVIPCAILIECKKTLHSNSHPVVLKAVAAAISTVVSLWYFVGRMLTSPRETIQHAVGKNPPYERGGPLGGILTFLLVVFLQLLVTAVIIKLLIASGPLAPFFAMAAHTIATGAPWLNTLGAAFSTFVIPTWGAALGGASTLLNIVLASTFFASIIGFTAKIGIHHLTSPSPKLKGKSIEESQPSHNNGSYQGSSSYGETQKDLTAASKEGPTTPERAKTPTPPSQSTAAPSNCLTSWWRRRFLCNPSSTPTQHKDPDTLNQSASTAIPSPPS